MTVFQQRENWFINNCRWIYAELHIIKCIHNANNKHNHSSVKCITKSQSNNSKQFIEFMQIYFELHWYFGGILHYINGIKHIVNLATSCDIFETLFCIFIYLLHTLHIHYHQRMLSPNNTHVSVPVVNVLSLAVYYVNNCFKVVLNMMEILLSLLKQVNVTIKYFESHMNNDKLKNITKYYFHIIIIKLFFH